MALKGDCSFAEALGLFGVIGRLGVCIHDFAIDGHGDFFSFNLDIVSEPLAIFVAGFLEVLDAVDAARLPPVAVGRIDLALVALGRPAILLIFGMDEDARVRFLGGLHFALEFEVFELGVAIFAVKEVGPLSLNLDRAFFNRKGLRVLRVDLPAIEGFSVEHGDPLSGKGEGSGGEQDCGE